MDAKKTINSEQNTGRSLEQKSPIVEKALSFSNDYFNLNHKPNLVFHNFQYAISLLQIIDSISENEKNIEEENIDAAKLAAIFYAYGYATNPKSANTIAIESLTEFLQENKQSEQLINKTSSCILALRDKSIIDSDSQKLFVDALNAHEFASSIETSSSLQKMEFELLHKEKLSSLKWNEKRLESLLDAKFYFPFSKVNYEPIVSNNILETRQKIERNKANGPKGWSHDELRKFQSIERRIPNSANQTFFRTNYRNHINLSAIADNKANIMISVNAILISVLISVLSYRNITETNPKVLMPVVIFMISGLTSLIFAVLSARPKVTRINTGKSKMEEIKKNITFFGNFVNLDLEVYEDAMDSMLRDSELVYGNMTRDLYFLGQVLDKKYRFLGFSYNVFMFGFALTVLTFMVALFG